MGDARGDKDEGQGRGTRTGDRAVGVSDGRRCRVRRLLLVREIAAAMALASCIVVIGLYNIYYIIGNIKHPKQAKAALWSVCEPRNAYGEGGKLIDEI